MWMEEEDIKLKDMVLSQINGIIASIRSAWDNIQSEASYF